MEQSINGSFPLYFWESALMQYFEEVEKIVFDKFIQSLLEVTMKKKHVMLFRCQEWIMTTPRNAAVSNETMDFA